MKIVAVDNLAREAVADRIVAVNIVNAEEADIMVTALQETCNEGGHTWYRLVPDDYVLCRGMADLI